MAYEDYETRVTALESEGLTRSDAQAAVDAEDLTYQSRFAHNDGGRTVAGYKGIAGDCVVRAIAIAAELPYQEVYDDLKRRNADFASGRSRAARSVRRKGTTPRNGNFKAVYDKYLADLGFKWVPTMQVGKGCTTHVRADELPAGRLILKLSRHLAAFIDGTLHDNHDSSRKGTRCVYGYWIKT